MSLSSPASGHPQGDSLDQTAGNEISVPPAACMPSHPGNLPKNEEDSCIVDEVSLSRMEKDFALSQSNILATTLARRTLGTAILLLIIGMICIPLDRQLAAWQGQADLPGDLRKAIELSELFAHGAGALVILGTLIYIDVPRRKLLFRATVMTAGAGILVNLIKLPIVRIRPHSLEKWLGDPNNIQPSLDSWLPVLSRSIGESSWHSFPSGHSAVATSLALGLATTYPRGWWIFALMASASCYQRFFSGAHYLGDIFCGSAIALIWCSLCISPRFIGRWTLPTL